MFGQHLSTCGERYTSSAVKTIVKDFVHNEEGFLSHTYTNILKKYYTADVAEKLYVFTGLMIKKVLKSWIAKDYQTDPVAFKEGVARRFGHRIQTLRFITVAPTLNGNRANTNRDNVHRALGELWNSPGFFVDRLDIHPGGAVTTACTQVGVYAISRHDGQSCWMKAIDPTDDFAAIYDYATADTLQALFHHPQLVRYAGDRTLGNLYRNMHSQETESIMQPTVNEEQAG